MLPSEMKLTRGTVDSLFVARLFCLTIGHGAPARDNGVATRERFAVAGRGREAGCRHRRFRAEPDPTLQLQEGDVISHQAPVVVLVHDVPRYGDTPHFPDVFSTDSHLWLSFKKLQSSNPPTPSLHTKSQTHSIILMLREPAIATRRRVVNTFGNVRISYFIVQRQRTFDL